jgi:hypothetical protein
MKLIKVVRNLRFGLLLSMMLALGGCALPPAISAAQISPIPPGLARVWFYRLDAPYITQARPYVRLNGVPIGISEDGGSFYRDVAPGQYYVTVDSYGVDINQFPHVILVPGETMYFQVIGSRYWASGGGGGRGAGWERPTFYVWVMPAQVAGPAIDHSHFYPAAG